MMLERYVNDITETAGSILEVADKPITLVYPVGKNLPPSVYGEDGSIGIRVCTESFCSELITRLRKPIVSTSANISNKPPPANFSEIDDYIIKSADYVVKYRQEDITKYPPSSIIKLGIDGTIKIIRE
jgi:L-threonylcarbamoyladenylate synthase